jgi:hypothetical protein
VRLRRADDSTDEIDADFEISVGDVSPLFTLTVESSGGATPPATFVTPSTPFSSKRYFAA